MSLSIACLIGIVSMSMAILLPATIFHSATEETTTSRQWIAVFRSLSCGSAVSDNLPFRPAPAVRLFLLLRLYYVLLVLLPMHNILLSMF